MYKFEYHLLYVLSEPPITVVQQTPHGWKAGDVLLAKQAPVSAADRFLVLDVNEHGRVMALKIAAMSGHIEKMGEYVHLGSKGLDLSEDGFDLSNSPVLRC
jgi:hypothetical protein